MSKEVAIEIDDAVWEDEHGFEFLVELLSVCSFNGTTFDAVTLINAKTGKYLTVSTDEFRSTFKRTTK
jgi:hypothetical protein